MKYYYKNMEFEVPETVYCPREDSELLAEIIETIDIKSKKALEIGCGSGFLSVLMAKNGADVTSVDLNPDAVDATILNTVKNGVDERVFRSDLFQNVDEKFDLIIFNPPYLPAEEKDLAYSGGLSGRGTIEKFIAVVKNYLNVNGKILLLISSLTGEKETIKLFEKIKMNAKSIKRKKVPWEELMVIEAMVST